MAVIDTTALLSQYKRVYGDRITDLFGRHTMTYNEFAASGRKASARPGGEGYYFSTRQGDVEGIGGRAENAMLPEPLPGDGVQGYIKPSLIYSVIRMSGLGIEAGKGGAMSFVDSLTDSTTNAFKSLVQDLNRQCWGDGYGLLGTTSAIATPSTSATFDVVFDNDRGTRYMKKGMICDFYQSGAIDVTSSSVRILSINPITKTVTFEANAGSYTAYHPIVTARAYTGTNDTIASGSFLVRYGARLATHTTSDAFYEMMGLNGMYDDGTLLGVFEGITIASDPEFKANILSNSSVNRELSIDLMLAAMDMTSARSTEKADIIRMGLGQRRKYFGLLSADIRFQPQILKGGYETLAFSQDASVKIVVDPVTQPNRLYFEPNGVIKKYELTPIGWGGFDANKMHWKEGYDIATCFLRLYAQLGIENRSSLTLLSDLTEPSSTPW